MGFTFEEFPNSDFYDSDLREIVTYLQTIRKKMDKYDKVIAELLEGLGRLDAIEKDVATLKQCCTEVREEINSINSEIDRMEQDISSLDTVTTDLLLRVGTLEEQVVNVFNYVDARFEELLAIHKEDFYLLLLKLNQAKAQLQAEIDELNVRLNAIDTNVYNPWIGRRVTQQENEEYTYNHLADECLTAGEYASLGYSADEYAELGATSNEYQEFGKTKLRFRWVFSPVYGFRQEINNVLCSIVNFLAGTMSSEQYASLDLTAEEYAEMQLTSEDYFRYNPFSPNGYVAVDPSGLGLTVNQFEHLKTV